VGVVAVFEVVVIVGFLVGVDKVDVGEMGMGLVGYSENNGIGKILEVCDNIQ